LGAHHWVLDLFNHFRLYFFVAFLVLVVGFWVRGHRGFAGLFLCLALVHGSGLFPLYFDHPPAPAANAKALTILHFNVYTQNPRRAEIIDYIRETEADLVFLLEVGPQWEKLLHTLSPDYRIIQYLPARHNFGIAVIGRVPINKSRIRRDNPFNLAALEVELEWEGEPLVIHAIHTIPPVDARATAARNTQLLDLAREVAASSHATLVVGDINATPWSSVSDEFEELSGLRNGQQGFGYQATWPTRIPVGRIPIDASYHSASMTVIHREIGPELGSDHLPVIFEVARRNRRRD